MTQRFKEKLVDWQVLHDNLAPRLTDLPQLAADHTALAQVLAQAKGLENDQEMARVAFQKVNQRRKALAKDGTALRNRLAHGLKSSLGPDNKELKEFRIKPQPVPLERKRLTPLQKAERAAARAAAKAAAAKAEEKAPTPAPVNPATP
jgi:septal ring factor EnvC (AmiA/AmiB activator)